MQVTTVLPPNFFNDLLKLKRFTLVKHGSSITITTDDWVLSLRPNYDNASNGINLRMECNRKYRAERIAAIRQLLATELTQTEIANKVGVSQSFVSKVNLGKV